MLTEPDVSAGVADCNTPQVYLKSYTTLTSDVSLDEVQVGSCSSWVENAIQTPEDSERNQEKETQEEPSQLKMSKGKAVPGLWTSRRHEEVSLRLEECGIANVPPMTVHEMFEESVRRYGDYIALGSKKGDSWHKLTYKQYYVECRKAARAFLKLGLERFRGVGILGFNSAEWLIADVGAILAGGLAVGIYTTNSAEACHYVAEHSEANILVVENDKQLQKILEVQSKLKHLKAIVQYQEEVKQKRPNLYSWAEFLALANEVPDSLLDQIIESQKPTQCCMLIYTSGTTGQPKGVMLSQDNITWTSMAATQDFQLGHPPDNQEVVVSFLPLSHVAAQMMDVWLPMKVGASTYFAQPDALKGSLVETLREVRPTCFLGVPRVWEKMEEKMKATGAKSSALKRKVAVWAKEVGLQTNLKRMNGCTDIPVNFRLAKHLVFKKVKKALGLDRCRLCFSGAAPMTKETIEFFLSLNIPVCELYGMSESTGPHSVSRPTSLKIMSCGKSMLGCKTKLHNIDSEETGEVCFWGRHVFMGYLNMEDKTKEVLDAEGWLHSGDLGKLDKNGFLYITGRIKELIITAGGENVPPVPIEDLVKEHLPIISYAMLVGDKAKFLSMLLTLKCQLHPDTSEPEDLLTPEAVEYCHKLGSKSTKVSDIVGGKDKLVFAAIQKGIDAVNEKAISNAQKIQKWTILEKDFSVSGGELGPTMKLKRPVVVKMYKDQISSFYSE
ncbi:long-chain-fatty-acid--CoA ligase ACSBG2 isoform X1 [Ornithorhynchus anatinus]|nr:long-chain-fatty-acid--CoA ligase ACSBG2 isoform X1 [Ornithorhynchus anatinus]XP_028906639.1 long-chain-fatty-acid--CoA ligase ACSBG2 isoform X1 [Ornithorhynchus anatinus]